MKLEKAYELIGACLSTSTLYGHDFSQEPLFAKHTIEGMFPSSFCTLGRPFSARFCLPLKKYSRLPQDLTHPLCNVLFDINSGYFTNCG